MFVNELAFKNYVDSAFREKNLYRVNNVNKIFYKPSKTLFLYFTQDYKLHSASYFFAGKWTTKTFDNLTAKQIALYRTMLINQRTSLIKLAIQNDCADDYSAMQDSLKNIFGENKGTTAGKYIRNEELINESKSLIHSSIVQLRFFSAEAGSLYILLLDYLELLENGGSYYSVEQALKDCAHRTKGLLYSEATPNVTIGNSSFNDVYYSEFETIDDERIYELLKDKYWYKTSSIIYRYLKIDI